MKKVLYFCLLFLIFIGAVLSVPFSGFKNASAEEYKSFYSKINAPLFYGVTGIKIDKNVTDNFSEKDSRFRIFAKDFEDGDVSPKIVCTFNNVQSGVAGNYQLKYMVADSHGNKSEITVPVEVRNKEEGECEIEQTVYAIPAMNNMKSIGTERCNTGDRQIFGVYLPENQSFQARMINGDQDLQITFFTNTRAKNSFSSIKANNSDYQTISNTLKDGTKPGSVPLVTSPRLKSEEIDKTFKIEIKYNSSVKALDYYHYKDNEQQFKDKWKASENNFGVVDGEAIMCVVSFGDIDKVSGYFASGFENPFMSLDEFLEYYLEVVNRFDKMIGLEFDAKSALDQNYRTKYIAIADGANAGNSGAYYGGNFIAVSSFSISPIFQYGWGTLHEIAHGYQGTLGKGMYLNETGNNILAHYIQIDQNLYKKNDRYIGLLKNCEQSMNESRKSKVSAGQTVFNNDGGTYTNTAEKLYSIVNMLDSFEGTKTYAKIFSFYRKLASGQDVSALSVADVYAKFFVQEYNVNIVPYLKQWTMPVTESVEKEIMDMGLVSVSILADALENQTLENVMEKENITLKYGLIREDVLQKYVEKCTLKINFEIDNINKIKNKNIALSYHGKDIKISKITSQVAEFSNLEIGTYELKLPILFGYENKLCIINLKENENNFTIKFEKLSTDYKNHLTTITIFGVNGTVGYSLKFENKYMKATPSLGYANLGNQNSTWEAKPDDVFASVTILKKDGTEIDKIEVKGKEYFFQQTAKSKKYDIGVGTKIIIYSERPDLVSVVSQITGNKIEEYGVKNSNTIEYEITENGLKLLSAENFDEKKVLYESSKIKMIELIKNYKEKVSETELENKRINAQTKSEVVFAFENLEEKDRADFVSLIEKIKRGGAPKFVFEKEKYSFKFGEEIDLYSLAKIYDCEDFEIECNSKNVIVQTNLNKNVAGEYSVSYLVSDSDGNRVSKTIYVSVDDPKIGQDDIIKMPVYVVAIIVASFVFTLIVSSIIILKVLKKRENRKNSSKKS